MTWQFIAILAHLSGQVPADAPPPVPPHLEEARPPAAPEAPSVEPQPPGSEAQPPSAAPNMDGAQVIVILEGGHQMAGTVVSLDDTTLVLALSGGAQVTLQMAQVFTLREQPVGGVMTSPVITQPVGTPAAPRQPLVVYRDLSALEVVPTHRTRYLYAPSAMTLRQGEGYFSQKEIVFSAAAFGVTDHLSVLVGSVLPALLFNPREGANGILALKYGRKVAPKTHVAVAAEVFGFGGEGFGLGGLIVTYGGHHDHISLVAGKPFSFDGARLDPGGSYLLALAGTLRLGPRWAMLSENWLITALDGSDVLIYSIGWRRFGRDHAFDLAFLGSGDVFGFPWVDWTYSWGQRDVDGKPVRVVDNPLPPAAVPGGFGLWQRRRAEVGLR